MTADSSRAMRAGGLVPSDFEGDAWPSSVSRAPRITHELVAKFTEHRVTCKPSDDNETRLPPTLRE